MYHTQCMKIGVYHLNTIVSLNMFVVHAWLGLQNIYGANKIRQRGTPSKGVLHIKEK